MSAPISRRAVLAGGVLAWTAGAADAMTSPFSLELVHDGPNRFKALLHNRSAAPQTVLVHQELQATTPTLTSTDGSPAPLEDQRAAMKFDTTPYKRLFRRIEPRATLLAGRGLVQPHAGASRFNWGTFAAHGLQPGGYRLRVVWTSGIREWADDVSGQFSPVPGVWIGEVASNVLELRL